MDTDTPVHVRVRVTPGSKKESFKPDEERNVFLASVREPAARNEANDRVRELVARFFGVPLKSARMLSGHRSLQKMFSIQR
jgi:uncharacterized protein YggU (UPF0235/DUF167 family)